MIPESRVMEMDDLLFMIHFKVENMEMEEADPPEDPNKGSGKEEEHEEDDDLLDEDPSNPQGPGGHEECDKGDREKEGGNKNDYKDRTLGSNPGGGQKINSIRRTLYMMEEENPRTKGG